MSQLDDLADRRRSGGFNARELISADKQWVVCYACRKRHELRGDNADHDYADFAARHPAARGCVVIRLGPEQMHLMIQRADKRRRLRHDSILNFTHNSSVLEAFQGSDQSIDLTSFNSLASSATAGWSSHYIDNSSNLYLDYLAYVKFAAVNTAPGNDKAYYMYAASALNTTDLPCSGAASGNTVANSGSTSATLTFPSIATPLSPLFPICQVIPYPVQNVANTTSVFSPGPCFNGWIGLYLWFPMLNYSGMTIAASGNVFKYRGVYNTVA